MRFLQENQLAAGFVPVDMSAANNAGDWVTLKRYGRIIVLVFAAVGTAGQDPVLTFEQATSAAGANAKALNITEVYQKAGASLLTVEEFTKVEFAATNVYTATGTAAQQKIIAAEIRGADLDVDGGFAWIRCSVADVGAAAQLGAMLYLATDAKYAGAVAQGIII